MTIAGVTDEEMAAVEAMVNDLTRRGPLDPPELAGRPSPLRPKPQRPDAAAVPLPSTSNDGPWVVTAPSNEPRSDWPEGVFNP